MCSFLETITLFQAPVLRDIAASALLAMRFSARVPRAGKMGEIYDRSDRSQTKLQQPNHRPLLLRGLTLNFVWVEIFQKIWGIIWVLGVLYLLGKNCWFSPLKRP